MPAQLRLRKTVFVEIKTKKNEEPRRKSGVSFYGKSIMGALLPNHLSAGERIVHAPSPPQAACGVSNSVATLLATTLRPC
jgi:hypothetical protein